MKLIIEDWVKNQKFDKEINILFKESFICYKSGAYKASYVFSYIGFLMVIKYRILNGNKPDTVPEGMWTTLIQNLRDVDLWEKELIKSTQNTTREVFIINNELRQQIIYWKDRRNDCVHYKNDLVNNAMVETFWNFLKIYLPKLVLNGSKNALLNKILTHFNPVFVQPESDFSSLINEIPTAVSVLEMPTFYKEILRSSIGLENIINFFNEIFNLLQDDVQAPLIEFILADENRHFRLWFLRSCPERVHILNGNNQKIRELWYTLLFTEYYNDFPILSSLLRNNLIPSTEINEAIQKSLDRNKRNIPSDIEYSELIRHNYSALLKDYIFNSVKSTDWINSKSHIIKLYLEKETITLDVAEYLNEIFSRNVWPWSLDHRLDELFYSQPTKKDELKDLLDDNNVTISVHLTPKLT